MQPCSREFQTTINSILNPSLQDLQNSHFDPSSTTTTTTTTTNDDFFDQVLSNFPSCSWTDLTSSSSANQLDLPGDGVHQFDESALLASKLRQHQIGGGDSSAAATAMMLQQQLLMARTGGLINGGDFERPQEVGDGRIQSMYNGFAAGSMNGSGHPSNLASHFQHPQNFTAQAAVLNQAPAASESTGGGTAAPAQPPKQRVRARRGQATDPHSIAERLRRERIAERMKALQELVPNANKTDKASMLDEIIDYVKFLQLQVKVLSMSRLGGAAAVAPLVGDLSSEGGGGGGGASQGCSRSRSTNGNHSASSNDNLTVAEHQVAKLMEEDMGSAMQYLQGKGLCLMPISLATAISTTTCQSMNPMISNHHLASNGEGPSSPSMSVLTVQSATLGNGTPDGPLKDAASVSKP